MDVKWIKITTDVFDDEKILLIESLPEADSIIVIWFKLLCLAGKQNNSGVFLMGDKIAYTDKMLATIFRRKESTVQLALQTFEQFGMIELIDGVITIPNWGKHQSLDQLENKKQYMKNYMREYRNKQKALTQNDKLCENGLPMNEWIEVLNFFEHECAYCGCKKGLEQEHIIPVDKGGRYVIGNIVPSCRKCNASKGSKEMQEWYSKSDVFSQERLERIMMYSCKTNINHLHKANVSRADKEEDKKKIREEKNNINHPTKADIDLFFDSIWNLYPVKKGKGQVSDSKRKALFKIGFEEMNRAIQRYLQELSKDSAWRKPQNGSTFFNSGYVDYLDANFVPDTQDSNSNRQAVNDVTHQQLKAIQERQQQEYDESDLAELEASLGDKIF